MSKGWALILVFFCFLFSECIDITSALETSLRAHIYIHTHSHTHIYIKEFLSFWREESWCPLTRYHIYFPLFHWKGWNSRSMLKQRSTDNSYYVEVYHPLCKLQGDRAFTFLMALSRKIEKYCKSEMLASIPDSGRNTPRHRVSS